MEKVATGPHPRPQTPNARCEREISSKVDREDREERRGEREEREEKRYQKIRRAWLFVAGGKKPLRFE